MSARHRGRPARQGDRLELLGHFLTEMRNLAVGGRNAEGAARPAPPGPPDEPTARRSWPRVRGSLHVAPAGSRSSSSGGPADAGRGELLACHSCTSTRRTTASDRRRTVVFLAGLGHLEGGHLVARQLLLPDYPHEAALLRLVSGELAALPRVVTYNGRGFDLPLLITRLTVHRLFREMSALPELHDDLLPVARRLYRRPLGGRDWPCGVRCLGVVRSPTAPARGAVALLLYLFSAARRTFLTDSSTQPAEIVSLALR